jgi:hypothetical protein
MFHQAVCDVSYGVALPFRAERCPCESDPNMNHALKNGYPPFLNEQSLKSAVESICTRYGNVAQVRIYPARREPGSGLQCACFLRLDTSEAETKLKSELKVIDFAGELAFFVNVDEEKWTGPTRL